MIRPLTFSLFFFIFFSFCTRKTPDYYKTEHGLKYKYHDISSDQATPNRGDYLTVYMQWKTKKDSIFYDSRKSSPIGIDIIKLGKPKHLGGIEEGIAKLQKGDSVSFFISPGRFYKDYLNQDNLPNFLKKEKEMVITIRLLEIESPTEYKLNLVKKSERLELNELKAVSQLVKKWKQENDSVIEVEGSFVVLENSKDTNRLKYGDIIKLDYEASFLNNTTFYSTYKNGGADEFQIGKEAQMVQGLKNALSIMTYNQKAKVLVPSYQGFGSNGSAGMLVPPYTPIIYKVNVLPRE
jgi:FKBP-type peptidyl-prolyl cis-trans isomerase